MIALWSASRISTLITSNRRKAHLRDVAQFRLGGWTAALGQLLLGHTKVGSTVRYLGIEVDDALRLSEQVELLNEGVASRGVANVPVRRRSS